MRPVRPFVPVALLLLTAPACASQATSKAETGETIATDPALNGSPPTDVVDASTTTTVPCHDVTTPPPPNVQLGDCGSFVIELQTRLGAVGIIVPVDGVFSAKTEEAVKVFQADRGLTVDGIVGPKTWAKLVEGGVGD